MAVAASCGGRVKTIAVRNRIVEAFTPLADWYAIGVYVGLPEHIDFDDIQSDAHAGLIRAVQSFDPSRNILFTSFCQRRIVGQIFDGLRNRDELPRLTRSRASRWSKLIDRFYVEHGRPASIDEQDAIAREQDIDADRHRAAAGAVARTRYLDEADGLREHH